MTRVGEGLRRGQQEPPRTLSRSRGRAEGVRVHAFPVRAEGTWAGGRWGRSSTQPVLPDLCSWADPSLRQVLKSHGQDYLVGNKLSRADIQLVELLYYVEELDPSLLATFPLLKALKTRVSNLPTVKKFLQPGSQRKPPVDEESLEKARRIFKFKIKAGKSHSVYTRPIF
ncbi:glutathione S-transferase A1-like [Phacochoerus africanus]|uniref:glutathione S-transferase A1-like n=1 Tax=Phacochoerus africanus TaxID=41426 RepID=UPI001FDA5D0A|nr:glutathione S-transferase A1-like [Phacochoerus africanus]